MTETPPSFRQYRADGPHRSAGTAPAIPDLEILRLIGKGAYGEVWLARSLTGAYRAVKIVWREDFDDERSFVREFEGILNYEPIARNIPGLVHILHVGQSNEPTPFYYYVMELADDARTGIHIDPANYIPRTLRSDKQQYGNRPMPLDYSLEVGSQLAHALQYLHAEGLTHRDVKPANVVFVNGRPKLADIGLVAHADQRSFVGTEGFIPPEGPGTPRADVYALAKVLYEITTGHDRLDFPELPDEKPEGASRKKWLALNNVICAAAEPRIDQCTVTTAEQLADAIDELRAYAPRAKAKDSPAKRAPFPWKTICFAVLAGLAIVFGMIHRDYLEEHVVPRLAAATRALLDEHAAAASPRLEATNGTATGSLYITTVPPGASIYAANGKYIDETPYGPIPYEANARVSFTLKKEGYADKTERGVIPEGGLLALGGEMKPYRPPRTGDAWHDALGNAYHPADRGHVADQPVGEQQFLRYLESAHPAQKTNHESIEWKDDPAQKLVLTTPEGISSYILWLTKQCVAEGVLGRDHTLNAEEEPGYASPNGKLKAYRLAAMPVRKTPITILTNPAGAAVTLNGQTLGVTPMQYVKVPMAPYYIELKMPGYTTVRHSGLNPKNLSLSINLKPNNSVVFGQDWINSLGMRFVSMGANLLAGANEVRRSDYMAFVRQTKRTPPPPPAFEQNAHHPVVNVTRADAHDFAQWLTRKEQAQGLIENSDRYRLPDDREWSTLAGLAAEEGDSPYERQQKAQTSGANYAFLWGTRWPPQDHTGNFADQSALPGVAASRIIPNYNDTYPHTSPVGTYAPSGRGIYDLSGNVQEWVDGVYGGPANFRFRDYGVVRGGSFQSFRPSQLVPSHRTPLPPNARSASVGFRLLLERSSVVLP